MAFLIVSGLIVTLFLRKSEVPSHLEDGHDYSQSRMESRDSANTNTQNDDQRQTIHKQKKISKSRMDKELDREEARFEKVDLLWSKIMAKKFEQMGLSAKVYDQYQMMREEFEQSALSEFEDFHQKLQAQKGENYKYRLTEFDDQVMNKLRKEYNEKLAKIVGEEAIREIVKTRDEFNEKLKRGTQYAHDDVLIDF
jgi:hypothetical protein